MKIEILFTEGCPNAELTADLVRNVLSEFRIDAEVELEEVASEQDAIARRFVGSPTVRVNGRDIDGVAAEDRPYALACRVYRTGRGFSGVPTRELIRGALISAV